MGRHARPRLAPLARARHAVDALPVEQQFALAIWAGGVILTAAFGVAVYAATGDATPLVGGPTGATLAGGGLFFLHRYLTRGDQ